MSKNYKDYKKDKEMSLEEAKAYRASLYVPEKKELSQEEKRELFRVFWAQEKNKYGKGKEIEHIIWAHLKSVKMDSPELFKQGLEHFGLKEKK